MPIYIDKYWDQFEPIETYWHYMALVAYALFLIIGLPANIYVIVYYLQNIKNRKSYNYLLVNLMIANIICLTNAPIVIYNSVYGTWTLGQLVCDIYGVCGGLFGFVSIITMTMISIERYMVIKYPLKILNTNTKMSVFAIIVTWMYGGVWCFLPFFTPHGFVPEGFLTSCTFDFLNQETSSIVVISMMTIFGFFIPVTTIILFYVLISVHIKNHYLKLKKNYDIDMSHISRVKTKAKHDANMLHVNNDDDDSIQMSDHETGATNNPAPTKTTTTTTTKKNKKQKQNKLTAELRLIRSSVIIVIMFCLSWLPYAIIALIAQHSSNRAKLITPSTVALPTIFAKSSAVTNPLIYAFTNTDFLKSLKKRLACK